ncbi:ligand-binding sensor domain-containing diguanylate cyclase [Duganella radicis]|uniref:diguanylate cyclase n=1 Tax=Duganella radicis TaxID=551988 RepID=A0A6L6PBF2_9BURK|nr:ligand-binding sensor domain-containing diguanylate cyclase [Duganella radicis]MTV36362.1 diguanylate cyclase [Duganella radicis]
MKIPRPVLVLLVVLPTIIRPEHALAQQLPLRYLGQQDGLANLSVGVLAQDQEGYLWVGTDNGLFRYNGAEFQRFGKDEGMTTTTVTAVLPDRRRRLWVGTEDGFYFHDGHRLVELLYQGQTLPIPVDSPLAAMPEGGVALISHRQLFHALVVEGQLVVRPYFPADLVQRQPLLKELGAVMAQPDGQLWLGCGASLCSSAPHGLQVWDAGAGVPADQWRNLTRAADGSLWARGKHHVIVLEPGGKRFIDRTPPGGLMRKANPATAMAEDADHRMLITTDTGVARWDAGRWHFFDGANGLKPGVLAILVDRDHGVWLGSAGRGLMHWIGYDHWENWTTAQGLPDDQVFAFLRDGAGNLRIGTRSGLAMLGAGAPRRAMPVPGYRPEQWGTMAVDLRGHLWNASYVGSLMREERRGGGVTQVAKLPMIFKLLADRQGRMWISTWDGLFVIEHPESGAAPQRPGGLPAEADLLSATTRRSCQSADGILWFLTDDTLWRLRGDRWDSYGLRAPRDPAFDMMACAADGSLWLGQGAGGLWRAHVAGSGLVKQAQQIPLLRDKAVFTIHEDRRGWLWLGTDAGLLVWNRAQWRLFGSGDGLVWNDLNARPLYEEADGSLWLPTSNGASHVTRPERLFAPHRLSASVEAVERAGVALGVRDGEALPWSADALLVTIASLHYEHRAALRFRYRLLGLERDWSSTSVPRLRYAALPPGEYRLQYAVVNLATESASPAREWRFTILPPWWRSNWFLLVCAVGALALLRGLYRYRVRGLHARNARMEEMVRARTRELELSQEALRERALRDGLTKAWNRVALLEMMEQRMQKSRRDGGTFLLCLLDLDHFKRINDTHGHLAGDAVLCELVRRLHACVRPYDLVGRYGGEEFLVLLADLNQSDGAPRLEAMRRAIEAAPFGIGDGHTLAVTASFGVAAFNPAAPAAGLELVRQADVALYRAKQRGRNRIEYAAPDHGAGALRPGEPA